MIIDSERHPMHGSPSRSMTVKDVLPLERRRHQTIDLREFADAVWLDIGIDSDSFVAKGDTRTRGVRISRLSLTN
jgi:hypothetical protein